MKSVVRSLVGLGMMVIGVLHFVNPEPFVRIVPPALPAPLLLVYLSGAFEVLFGALQFVPKLRTWAALGLILLYIAVFPANIYMALEPSALDPAHPIPAWALWARLPLQLVLVAVAYWLSRPEPEDSPNFVPLEQPSSFRRMAAAMWRSPNDPTIYGNAEIDMSAALEWLRKRNEKSDVKMTVTHFVARALALSIARFPEMNARVRFWGKLERRQSVDVFMQVTSEGGKDLSGLRINAAETKPIEVLARELQDASAKIRTGDDPKFKKSKSLIAAMPWWLVRPFLSFGSFLTNELLLDLSGSGMPPDPFGCAMVTSLGMYGIDEAYAPMTPVARCMVIVLVPVIRDKVVVHEGKMAIRPILKLCATFDHRVVDGVHAARLCQVMRDMMAAPDTHMPNG